MKQFAVVEFTDSKSVEIVPSSWLSADEQRCYWPPLKSAKVAQMVKDLHIANSSWRQHGVKLLGTAGLL